MDNPSYKRESGFLTWCAGNEVISTFVSSLFLFALGTLLLLSLQPVIADGSPIVISNKEQGQQENSIRQIRALSSHTKNILDETRSGLNPVIPQKATKSSSITAFMINDKAHIQIVSPIRKGMETDDCSDLRDEVEKLNRHNQYQIEEHCKKEKLNHIAIISLKSINTKGIL